MKRTVILSGVAAVLAGVVWAAEPLHDMMQGGGAEVTRVSGMDGVQLAQNSVVKTTASGSASVPAAPVFRAASNPLAPQPYDRVLGRANAPVTIVEYASMTCSHCRRLHVETLPQVQKEWIATGKARYILRDLPWDNLALGMAATARCAPAKAYYPLVSALFNAQMTVYEASDKVGAIAQVARMAGMSRAKVEACIRDEGYQNLSTGMKVEARGKLGITGTPVTFVNGQKIEGFVAYADLKKTLDAAYAKATARR